MTFAFAMARQPNLLTLMSCRLSLLLRGLLLDARNQRAPRFVERFATFALQSCSKRSVIDGCVPELFNHLFRPTAAEGQALADLTVIGKGQQRLLGNGKILVFGATSASR